MKERNRGMGTQRGERMKKLLLKSVSVVGVKRGLAALGAVFLLTFQNAMAEDVEKKFTEIQELQRQEDEIMLDYQKKKRALDDSFQQALNDLGDSKEKEAARVQLIQDTKKKQEDIKNQFQEQLRGIQKKERKLRTGREELDTGGIFYQGQQQQQLQKDLQAKRDRQELLKKQQMQNTGMISDQQVAVPPYQQTPETTVVRPPSSNAVTSPQKTGNTDSPADYSLQHNKVRFRDPTQKTLEGSWKELRR